MSEWKKTPVYDSHLKLGGKMVPFAGYEMPVQYAGLGIMEEHKAVRERVGLFDVSHMGEFKVSGSGSLEYLQKMTLNDVSISGGDVGASLGGGIRNGGTLTLSSGIVSGNSAVGAGGIMNSGMLTLTNTTVS